MFLYTYNGVIWSNPTIYDGSIRGRGLHELTEEEASKLPWEFFFKHSEFELRGKRGLCVTYIDHEGESYLYPDCCKGVTMSFLRLAENTSGANL